jgi:hemerythrin superfamily protein
MTEANAPAPSDPSYADTPSDDVVAFLKGQHQQISELLERVLATSGSQRQQAFDSVRELLARHETGEEMVVRPLTRSAPAGEGVAASRMDEENEAKKVLAKLDKMNVDDPAFASAFGDFRQSVLTHAEAEERDEFPLLRDHVDAKTLTSATRKLKAAEMAAPTHPHPSADTTVKNYVTGPFAAMLDRAKDFFTKTDKTAQS